MTSTPSNDTAPKPDRAKPKAPGIRQAMSDLHTWAGLLCGWLLYAMFLTGTVSYFKDEISQYMRPELHHPAQTPDPADVVQRIVGQLGQIAPGSTQWSMRLPDERHATVSSFWRLPRGEGKGGRGFDDATFDATTGEKVAARDTVGGEFFYRFHFQFHYMPVRWGRWLAGFCAMFMLVAIVSGVITHKKIFTDFFTFRWGKGQRSWLDAHNALSVFGLPFHLMITYTGLVTLMALYMPWGEQAAYKTPAQRQELTAETSPSVQPVKATGQSAPLAPIDAMVRQGQERWGQYNVSRVIIANPGDSAARVSVVRGEAGRVSMSPQYMVFDGASGQLLQTKDTVGPAAETRGVMYALHLGRFGDVPMRWLYFIVSLAGTAMVGTGLVMWTVKRRQKLGNPARPHFGFTLVERLNIASIAGLSIAMAAFLWGNRLLPLGMAERTAWEVHVFFVIWALTLLHAMVRPARRAWVEQFWAAAALLALLPVVSAFITDRPLWRSLIQGDWVFAGFELMLWVLAGLHVWLAVRTARHQPKQQRGAASAAAVKPPVQRPAAHSGMPPGATIAEEGVR
ncbi:MAG: PepSY domain-containing protein [Gammaproteobacteria bacterium]|nr:PepSY domain-containing protein [Gammaproteobacteria bacterium]MBU1507997.1 PepSY domain-containing protein [Gammaproteobacteria bacterium]MBU2173177.1 PepSY domain-containing protein [Gammaproteobacteria bacterium]MBU2199375.1 PepSY domain-containing protein [Gammaproteobacteria bacterium]MBU2275124.1 PepSY domain-containing protein [Gammaproteobacteria bacterium]